LPCALDRRLASASVSSKAIIAILSKTRPVARMVLLPVRQPKRPPALVAAAAIAPVEPSHYSPSKCIGQGNTSRGTSSVFSASAHTRRNRRCRKTVDGVGCASLVQHHRVPL